MAGTWGKPWKPDTNQEFSLIDQHGCASLAPQSGAMRRVAAASVAIADSPGDWNGRSLQRRAGK